MDQLLKIIIHSLSLKERMMKKRNPIFRILWLFLFAMQMGQYAFADDRQMNDDVTTTEQIYPQIAMNRYGYLALCWEDYRNGNADIFTQIYTHKGRQLVGKEANFQVNTVYADSAQQSPDIDINPRGHFVVVWEDRRSGRYDIYARLFTPKGDPKGEAFQVNDEIADISHRFPQVAMDHDGNFVVCWVDPRFDIIPNIYAQRFDANGQRLGGNFRVNTPNDGISVSPKIDMNPDGDFIIAWMNNAEGGYINIYVQRYQNYGDPYDTNIKVSNHPGQNNSVQYHDVALQANGDYLVVWSYGFAGLNAMIYARLFQWTGAQIRSQFTVHEETDPGEHHHPNVVAIPDSGYQVVYARYQTNWDVYTRELDDQGQPVNGVSLVTDETVQDQFLPVVGVDERGIQIIVWQDNRNDNSDIYAARAGEYVPLNVTAGSGFNDIVPIIWNPIFSDTENRTYNIYRSTLPEGPYSLLTSVNTADRPFPQLMHDYIDNSVSNNVSYYYQVESTSSESTGRSEPVSGKPDYPSFRMWSVWTDTPPVIDGLIESGVWDDADVMDISVEWTDSPVQIYALNDSSTLYLAINDPNDTTLNPGNLMGFMFDLNNNKAWDPGDGRFDITNLGAAFTSLSGAYPDISVGALTLADGVTASFSTASGHMQYEVAINFETSMLQTEADDEIGAGFWIDDPDNFYPSAYGNTAIWPPNALWETPQTLGKFILDADFPPIPVSHEMYSWPMFKRTKEQDSWARYEDELYPPFDEPMTYYEPFVGGLAYGYGILYYGDADTSGDPLRVLALDLESYETQWEYVISGTEEEDYVYITPAVGTNQVVAGAMSVPKYFGIDRLTGEPIWTRENRTTPPILDSSRVYIMTDSCFFCFETATGTTQWSTDISEPTTPAVDDSNVYVIADSMIMAFDKWDGTEKWQHAHIGHPSLAVDAQYVYTVQEDGDLTGRNKRTGLIEWYGHLNNGDLWISRFPNALALTDDYLCVPVTQDDDTTAALVVFDKSTGDEIWRQTFARSIVTGPIVANDVVYTVVWRMDVGQTSALWGFDLATGDSLFHDNSTFFTGLPIVADHMLLVPSMNGIKIYSNSPLVSVDQKIQNLQPTQFALHQNYPNPFNPKTVISYQLPVHSLVELKIFDLLGREIATLINEEKEPGEYTVEWNGKGLPSGMYLYRLKAGAFTETRKLVLQK